MAAEKVTCLNHVSRESSNIKRLAQFYQEIFGFVEIEAPKFEFEVIWLKLSASFYLHLIERDPSTKLPEGPWSSTSAVADPRNLPRGHHICFSVPNFDSFLQSLKGKEIEVHERALPDGKAKQAFFFDPDDKLFVTYLVFTEMDWRFLAGFQRSKLSIRLTCCNV